MDVLLLIPVRGSKGQVGGTRRRNGLVVGGDSDGHVGAGLSS